jgi:hypothetical protein
MGFLRKVGKKIKKGMGKLFGSKFGKIIGGIGLAMLFWGGASSMFSGQGWWKGVGDAVKNMNPFAKPDLTSAVNEVGKVATDTVVGTGAETVKSEALAGAAESVKAGLQVGKESSKAFSFEGLSSTPFKDLSTTQKIAKAGVETAEFLTPSGEFGADIAKGTLTSLAVQAAQGTPVDEGGYGNVQPNIGGEPAQAVMMAEVKNQIPTIQSKSFLDLYREPMYGTLSPNFLAQFGQV